jgi:uncharacterized membrane protein
MPPSAPLLPPFLAALPVSLLGRGALALGLAALIARRGLARGSLSASGAAAAALLGAACIFANLALGLALLAFYFSGSHLTRRKEELKLALDADAVRGGGRRGAAQVACTAGAAAALALLYCYASGGRDSGLCLALAPPPPAAAASAAASATSPPPLLGDLATLRTLAILGACGALACVSGDTWASELGVVAPGGLPRLVTTGAPVPRGTSGGVSLYGTLASIGGGLLVGAALGIDALLYFPRAAACIDVAGRPVPADRALPQQWAYFLVVGAASGLVGSLVDSYLGATVQRTWFDARSGKVTARLPSGAVESSVRFTSKMARQAEEAREQRAIVAAARRAKAEADDKADPRAAGGRRRAPAAAAKEAEAQAAAAAAAAAEGPQEWIVVAGRPWLSNEGVNLASSIVAAALAASVGGAALPLWAQLMRALGAAP